MAQEKCIGWDGRSNPIIRFVEDCGCQYRSDGTLDQPCNSHFIQAMREASQRKHDPLECHLGEKCPYYDCN